MSELLRRTAKGLFLHIRATPKSRLNQIVGQSEDGSLLLKVTALPDKGKANLAVIETLAKSIGVAKSSFELVSGETNRNKVLRITANEAAICAWLVDFQKNLK